MAIDHCPKGHDSTEADFCSQCGAKIAGALPLANAAPPVTPVVPPTPVVEGSTICPDCTAPHDLQSGLFCEICGYNFHTGAHGEVPLPAGMPAPATELAPRETVPSPSTITAADVVLTPRPAPPGTTETAPVRWQVVATVDPSLHRAESPEPPIQQAPLTFQLEQESCLIGRRSELRGIFPDIALDFDDAVSHRHALLTRQPDGSFSMRDIGSANGTTLNGVDLEPLVDTPLKTGDEITLGHWTRLTVQIVH